MMARIVMFVLVLLGFFASGCWREAGGLDVEIAALPPDAWDPRWNVGASLTNCNMLTRVLEVADASERIRLARMLRDHFWHAPEWFVAHGSPSCESVRFVYVAKCSSGLTLSTNATAETVFAGWRMTAEFVNDVERVLDLTENSWTGGSDRQDRSEEDLRKEELFKMVRGLYERFFTYHLPSCSDGYRIIPPADRPAFVEQIKRDFFGRKGMAYVDMDEFPEAFKK